MSDRKRRLEIAKTLKELLQSKGKAPSFKYQQTFEELKEASDLVSKWLTRLIAAHLYLKSGVLTLRGSYYWSTTSRTFAKIEKNLRAIN